MANEANVIDEWTDPSSFLRFRLVTSDPARKPHERLYALQIEDGAGDWQTVGQGVQTLGRRLSALLAERRQESEPEGATLGFIREDGSFAPVKPEGGR